MATSTQRHGRWRMTAILAMLAAVLVACGAPSTGGGSSSGPFTIGISNGFVGSEWCRQMLKDVQDAYA